MTSDIVRQPDKRYNYSNAATGLINLVKNEGIRALWRGLGTNTVLDFLTDSSLTDWFTADKGRFDERKCVEYCSLKHLNNPLSRLHKLARMFSNDLA